MRKNIMVVCGSSREFSNSALLAKALCDGAQSNDNFVETIYLSRKNIKPCIGCNYCRKKSKGKCFQSDDMQGLYALVEKSDIIVLASPLYFLTVSAQIKTFIDRLYCKHHAGTIVEKKGVLLSTSGGPGSDMIIEYFEALCKLLNWENIGVITQGGMGRNAELREDKLKEAYALGENL
ncbi:MAG: flavodoxin family protein [Oscillospiraceae bacterium]|jgi:multimeric flavodoxin WrbA|nr:flavodoxin family protein [Oscillospiraceae bacterium]